MESLVAETVEFVFSRSPGQIFSLLWYFFVFEFPRYILLDFVAVPMYLWRRSTGKGARLQARGRLYSERPLVSYLIPGRNEAENLPGLISSIHGQTYSNVEIIVVDDGSTDHTRALGKRMLSQGRIQAFFRAGQRGGQSSAKNLALRYARGKFVVQLDADCTLHPRALEEALLPYYMPGGERIGAVGGDLRVLNAGKSLCTSLQTLEYLKTLSVGRVVTSTIGTLRIVSGAWGIFPANVIKRVGGFDPGPGLDGDLVLKIRKLGYRIYHEPASVCFTNVPETFRALAKQRFRWERGVVRMRLRKHGDMLKFWQPHFRLTNFLTVADNVLFHLIFNYKWWFYVAWVVAFYPHFLKYLLVIKLFLYTTTNVVQYAVALTVVGSTTRRSEILFAALLPLMPFYNGVFMRLVRTFAHTLELLFKVSYLDAWAPWKVSRVARREGL